MSFKFLCDATVLKLAKWLRFLGQDTESTHFHEPDALLKIADAENRIILTRNTEFNRLPYKNVYVLESDFLFEQLKDVIKHFNIREPRILTRCSKCNAPLLDIPHENVRGKVPYFTYKNFNEFKFCPVCNKIYWRGSHIDLMIKRLKKEGIWELLF